jgi:hypothetical protein
MMAMRLGGGDLPFEPVEHREKLLAGWSSSTWRAWLSAPGIA